MTFFFFHQKRSFFLRNCLSNIPGEIKCCISHCKKCPFKILICILKNRYSSCIQTTLKSNVEFSICIDWKWYTSSKCRDCWNNSICHVFIEMQFHRNVSVVLRPWFFPWKMNRWQSAFSAITGDKHGQLATRIRNKNEKETKILGTENGKTKVWKPIIFSRLFYYLLIFVVLKGPSQSLFFVG